MEELQHRPTRRCRTFKVSVIQVKKEEEASDTDEQDDEGVVDSDYIPPRILKKQIKQESGNSTQLRKLVAVNQKDVKTNVKKTKISKRKSASTRGRRMADLTVIDEVVNQLKLSAKQFKKSQIGKPVIIGSNERILSKRMQLAGTYDLEYFEDVEFDEADDIPEKVDRELREFEKFQKNLRKIITLPPKWGMGGVIWDPLNKMKVIVVSEVDIQINGHVRLKRAIQVFEDRTVKVSIDGFDMTLNFGVQSINTEEDIGELIDKVAVCRVCSGVKDFQPDDIMYFPYVKERGCIYYAESCPVIIIDESGIGTVCNPCMSLQHAVLDIIEKEQLQIKNRKERAVPQPHLKNEFGKSLYGLLNEILDDAGALKSDRKDDRDAVISKYKLNHVKEDKIQTREKLPYRPYVSENEVTACFQDIVSRLGFHCPENSSDGKVIKAVTQQPIKSIIKNNEEGKTILPSTKSSVPRVNMPSVTSASKSSNFATSDHAQTYELEVDGVEIIQLVNKGSKTENIEIIEVDDNETMAKIAIQN